TPLILSGDNMAVAGAHNEVGALAELAGAPVMVGTGRQWNFPSNHPLNIGPLGFLGSQKDSLAGYDFILAMGTGNPFSSLFYEGGTPIPDNCPFVHIDVDSWEMGKNYPLEMSVLADPAWAARDIRDALERLQTPAQRSEAEHRKTRIAERKAAAQEKSKRRSSPSGTRRLLVRCGSRRSYATRRRRTRPGSAAAVRPVGSPWRS